MLNPTGEIAVRWQGKILSPNFFVNDWPFASRPASGALAGWARNWVGESGDVTPGREYPCSIADF